MSSDLEVLVSITGHSVKVFFTAILFRDVFKLLFVYFLLPAVLIRGHCTLLTIGKGRPEIFIRVPTCGSRPPLWFRGRTSHPAVLSSTSWEVLIVYCTVR